MEQKSDAVNLTESAGNAATALWTALDSHYASESAGIRALPRPVTWTELHRFGEEVARIVHARNAALLRELQAADRIISNALQIMTPEQKDEWARMNDAADLIESGTTRHHERAAVIAQALGEQS